MFTAASPFDEKAKAPSHCHVGAGSAEVLKRRYPHESRPETAIALYRQWAMGNVKMPVAKRALLQVHAMAKEVQSPVDIALCHAGGQACASVHVETHGIGLAMYELTANVREYGIDQCEQALRHKLSAYLTHLQ